MIPEVTVTSEQAKALEEYLEFHMSNCLNSIYDENDVYPGWEPFGPFCGCFTCESREWLMATFKFLRDHNIVSVYVDDTEEEKNTLFEEE
jgi:hypothetical protein